MPYQRMKEDTFNIFGGINQKASIADVSPLEFLDISNMDFERQGGLQQRPGTTFYAGTANLNQTLLLTANGYTGVGGTQSYMISVPTGATIFGYTIASITEFTNLQGASFITYDQPGGFAYGTSLPAIGSFSLQQLYFVTGASQINYLFDPAGRTIGSSTGSYPVNPLWDFKVFVNRLFMCNGDHFYKWDGNTSSILAAYQGDTYFSAFLGATVAGGVSAAAGAIYWLNGGSYFFGNINSFASNGTTFAMSSSGIGVIPAGATLYLFSGTGSPLIGFSGFINAWNSVAFYPTVENVFNYCLPSPGFSIYASPVYALYTTQLIALGVSFPGAIGTTQFYNSATYTFSFGYINDRGFHGPVTQPLTVNISLTPGWTTYAGGSCGLYVPYIYIFGFSNIVNGFNGPGNSYLITGFSCYDGYGIGCSGTQSYNSASIILPTGQTALAKGVIYRDNGPGTGRYFSGYAYPESINLQYPYAYPFAFTDNGQATSGVAEPTCIFATLAPQYLEIFNNQMFMCGFSQAPSTVQFSDIGEPESIQPQNNFDFRTNDGDFLTGMKAAFGSLFLFKNKSFAVLNGTDPTNFDLVPISDQYGSISHRAIATYQSYLMFLDKKGIVLYNGAIPMIASTKLDPIFANMNLAAAAKTAWMIHVKQKNQVWCGIPVNGSTMVNQIIVYDYISNAWTHHDGLNAACAAIGFGNQALPTPFIGGYSNAISYFGASLTSDAFTVGGTISMYAQTRFFADLGQSVEKMWRRLFMNTLSAQGATNLWLISLYANFASTPSITFIQGGQSFQSRSDFGVSAKTLSVRFSTGTNSDTLQLLGLTIESRFHRST